MSDLGPKYGSVPTSEGGSPGPTIVDIGMEHFQNLKKYIEEGDWTWKTLGLIAAVLMAAAGICNFLYHTFVAFTFLNSIVDLYIVAAGVIFASLEYKETFLPPAVVNYVRTELHLMCTPYGRSMAYIFWGVLMMTQATTFYFWAGLYATGVGMVIFYHARKAEMSLAAIKAKQVDEESLKALWKEMGTDGSTLNSEQLAKLCSKLGSPLNYNELEAAVAVLDRNHDGKIQFDEFLVWYRGY